MAWRGNARLAMLRTHYRQPIDWTAAALDEAWSTGRGWRKLLDGTDWRSGSGSPDQAGRRCTFGRPELGKGDRRAARYRPLTQKAVAAAAAGDY